MITRLGMAPRLPGSSVEQFQHHYRTSHGGVAGQIPNLRAYVQYHAVLVDGRPVFPYPGFDACSTLEFDSIEDMDEGFASETYQTAVRADEDAFIRKAGFSMFLGDRVVVVDGEPGDDAVVLLTLRRHHAAATRADFYEVFGGAYADAVAATGPLRYEQLRGLDIPRTGREVQACDGVELRWFASVDKVTGDTGAETELAGVALGTERLLARPNRVL